ncbi:sulfur carrier protein ThiS [Saccharopolyspora taberi]|uniref:Sulfur carrier protein ThiS n=1 Tax=Saccharopolyspora taberi TaxID=60895 RepID=A0ABN3VM89_9PSEU
MNVVLNGTPKQVSENTTLEVLLRDFGFPERGIAVAVDGSVVPRASWPATGLHPDATVEVLTAVQGG